MPEELKKDFKEKMAELAKHHKIKKGSHLNKKNYEFARECRVMEKHKTKEKGHKLRRFERAQKKIYWINK